MGSYVLLGNSTYGQKEISCFLYYRPYRDDVGCWLYELNTQRGIAVYYLLENNIFVKANVIFG